MTGYISLEGMHFVARHGVYPEEKAYGNEFTVDLSCEYDISRAMKSDMLSDTLDQAALYRIVSEEMARPSNLLEHLAGRIIESIRYNFPEVKHLELRVSKVHPPVDGPVDRSSVTVKI